MMLKPFANAGAALVLAALCPITVNAKEGLAREAIKINATETVDAADAGVANGTDMAFFHERTTTAFPKTIWKLWTNADSWKEWDRGLKSAELAGKMKVGSEGKIYSESGPPASFVITEYRQGKSYTFVTSLPSAKLTIRRSFVGKSPTRFRHDVSFSGPMATAYVSRLGPSFRKALPPTMDALANLAEARAK